MFVYPYFYKATNESNNLKRIPTAPQQSFPLATSTTTSKISLHPPLQIGPIYPSLQISLFSINISLPMTISPQQSRTDNSSPSTTVRSLASLHTSDYLDTTKFRKIAIGYQGLLNTP